jgi:hypothetical protein
MAMTRFSGSSMLPLRSISSLYPLALAEGEGIGTAYEYYAKRLVLARWLASLRPPRRLLIAGLPEKYGSSLDFFLLAQDLAVTKVVVIEDRPWALEKCRQSLAAAQAIGELTRIHPQYIPVTEMGLPNELTGKFDMCLGSEVLQRLAAIARRRYVSSFANLAPILALFVPNGDNSSHGVISSLSGLSLTELRALIEPEGVSATCGYVDMPPFPPGLTRSAAQRERAANGKLEGLATWALGHYARLETYFPLRWRRLHSHIAYALVYRPVTID